MTPPSRAAIEEAPQKGNPAMPAMNVKEFQDGMLRYVGGGDPSKVSLAAQHEIRELVGQYASATLERQIVVSDELRRDLVAL